MLGRVSRNASGDIVAHVDKATLLDSLTISEVSGVDDPANATRGWGVMKAANVAADDASLAEGQEEPSTVLAKVRALLGLTGTERTDEFDMDSTELKAILDERDEALVEKFAAVVKSVETPEETPVAEAAEVPAPVVTEAPAEVEAVPGLTADDVSKAIQDAFAPYNEILEKVLDRIEGVEDRLGIAARKSLDGQETNEVEETEATTKSKGSEEIGVVRYALGNQTAAAR